MKKFLLSICALLVYAGGTHADDAFSVDNIILPQNGEADVVVRFSLDEGSTCSGYTFWLQVPEELTFVTYEKNGKTNVTYTAGDCYDETPTITPNIDGGYLKVGCMTANSDPISGSTGTLVTFRLKVIGAVEVGDVLTGTLLKGTISSENGTPHDLADATFSITIGQPADTRVVLDENSTAVPAAATNVDVRVKRTIKAGEWSTICLPFAMSEAQVKEAFGEDVDLADFDGTDPEFDGDDCVGIRANFTSVNAIEANHPYIIKVSQPISEFTLDDVDIVADEDEAYIEFDNGKTGSRRVVYSGFYGTYHAGTALDEFTLFLSDNKFWYSKGQTKMKAFRAYFEFLDVLTDVKNSSNVKLWVRPDVEDGLPNLRVEEDLSSPAYNLAGQRVGKSYKGVVIENGRKIVK